MEELDVLVVGAGLSGIAAGYHLQTTCPDRTWAIVEARDAIGGTWDLFRYPGIRSDSDMYTLGYSFRPWKAPQAIADGPAILNYVRETAAEFGIDRRIRFHHRVDGASWDTASRRWTVRMTRTDTGDEVSLRCRFVMMCGGYYDYDAGYTPEFPGIGTFGGQVVHPQHWGDDVQWQGRRVVVIGSGATAITLVPSLAKEAAHVTMLQRSPSYVVSLPSVDPIAEGLKKRLPAGLAHQTVRWKNVLMASGTYHFCRTFPAAARRLITDEVKRRTRGTVDVDTHFQPRYNPWEQRLCLVPDADLFRALREGRAEVATDTIDTFTPTGIRLSSGRELDADLVVTATGLRLRFLGGMKVEVDGHAIDPADTLIYKGAMLSGIPNLAMAFGYTNASWTLKCDLSCKWFCQLLDHMKKSGREVVMPDPDPPVDRQPLVDFSSGYFQRAMDILPRQGDRPPWRVYQNYLLDLLMFRVKPLEDEGLTFL
jgi:cation diffusion facilitator CzcD-associated flavoprotein CzcO